MKILGVLLITVFLLGCGPSKREVELESQLKKAEQKIEKSEKIQAQKNLKELKKQQSEIKIDGSVFVKTKGGENFKLALIPIGVSTLEEYESACSTVVDNINVAIKSNAPTVKSNKAKYLDLNLKYKSALAAYKPIESKDREAMYQAKKEIVKNGNKVILYVDKAEVSHSKPNGGTKAMEQKYVDSLNNFREKTIEYWKPCNALYKELSSISVNSSNIVSKIMSKVNPRVRNVIKALHDDAIQTRSNADGKFSLKLELEKDYVLTGYGERQAGGVTETYNWIVPIKISSEDKDKDIFFSNDELTEKINGENNIMNIPDQIPLPASIPLNPESGTPKLWTHWQLPASLKKHFENLIED